MDTKRITDINGLNYLWKVDNLYLAGQPSNESWTQIKDLGVKKIINLRSNEEMDFSEEIEIVKSLDLEYEQFPIMINGALDLENSKKLCEMLDETNSHFIHCASANRVGGWLIVYLHKYRGMSLDEAIDIASNNGLSNPAFIAQAEEICDSL